MSDQWSDNLRKRMETHQEPSPEGLWEDIERAMKQNDSITLPEKNNNGIMSDQWEDDLRKRMETHQEPAPEGLWEDIEWAMKQNNSIVLQKKQNKVLLLWSKRIGAAAAVALIMLFVGDYFLKENPLKPIAQEKETPYNPEGKLSTLQNNEKVLVAEAGNNSSSLSKNNGVVAKIKASKESLLLEGKDNSNLIAKVEEATEQEKEIKREDSQSNSNVNVEKKKGDGQEGSIEKKRVFSNEYSLDTNLPALKNKYKSSKLGTNIYASNLSLNSTKKYEGYGNFNSREVSQEIDEDFGEDPVGDILVGNKYREVYTDVKHRQPIIIGASINYNLNEKWSLTSGLTYTILSSELRSGSDSYYYTSEQTLHNVGIPLDINYNVWKSKKMSVYLSGRGLVEKNVSGKLMTDYVVGDKLQQSKEDKISVDQLQWSLNTSAGVLYSLSQKVGLYAEPGVSYHFNNGSEVETIYKEKPVNFSLRLGLRISFGK